MGTLIRHARLGLPAAAPVIALTIAMIEPSFRALLVAAVGASSLVGTGLFTALVTAVALSSIAVRADEEHRVTLVTEANSQPEYRFAMNWPCVIAGGSGQRQWFRGRLEPAQFGFTCRMVAELGTLPL